MGIVETAQAWTGADWTLGVLLMVAGFVMGAVGVPLVLVVWGE